MRRAGHGAPTHSSVTVYFDDSRCWRVSPIGMGWRVAHHRLHTQPTSTSAARRRRACRACARQGTAKPAPREASRRKTNWLKASFSVRRSPRSSRKGAGGMGTKVPSENTNGSSPPIFREHNALRGSTEAWLRLCCSKRFAPKRGGRRLALTRPPCSARTHARRCFLRDLSNSFCNFRK